ncbi:MAG: tripartite tricarboxylate transporter TctB family protein [Gemmobacter sp.]
MSRLDIRELAGGLFLTATGAGFAGHAIANYSIGTVTRMGPGMVPAGLGVLLVIFGLVVIATAFLQESKGGSIRIAIPAVILLSVLAFALLITPFGLIPAVVACVIVATLAEEKFDPAFSLKLAAVLCLIAWLVFVVALQLPVTLFAWPF